MNPVISVIIPCYNEQGTICLLLESLLQQSFPVTEMEVIIADGLSSDQTRPEIASFSQSHPQLAIQVVDNPQRHIPIGLNRAIRAARGQYIVRLDAHSIPYPTYLEKCLAALQEGKGDNVGGVWEIRPYAPQGSAPTLIAQAISAAAAHPLGVGDALYRLSSQPQAVDTVPFGAFSRSLLERIGPFDESLLSNEDYEFNTRIRRSGGRVWLDPAIRSVYFSRSNLGALARQYWRYGYWKVRMLKRHPDSLRWRQALPPLFVASLATLAALSPWLPLARYLLLLEILGYLAILLLASLRPALQRRELRLAGLIPLAITVMHISWGSGFLWSALELLFRPARKQQGKNVTS